MRKNTAPRRSSIVRKLSLTNIIIFVCASALSILATLALNVEYHIDSDAQKMKVYISNTLNSIDNTLKDMGRVSLIAFSDQTVQSILKGSDYTLVEKLHNDQYLTDLYTSMISIRDDITGIYMFNQEEMVFYNDTNEPFFGFNQSSASFFDQVKLNSDLSTNISGCHMYLDKLPEVFTYKTTFTDNVLRNNNIYLVRPVRSFSPFEVIGYIALRTPVETVYEICSNYLEEDVSYALIDENENVACASQMELIGQSLREKEPELLKNIDGTEGSFTIMLGGQKYLGSYQRSDYSNMLLLTLKTYESIYEELMPLIITCSVILIASAGVILCIVYVTTKKNLKRLTDFSVDLQNFQPDDLIRQYEVGCLDEVGVLKDSFNKMIRRLNALVISEYQARDQLQKAEISEQRMAMLYLKQQINPHFLYNTLDMIRLKAAINKDTEVSQMLMKLVSFYRLSTKVHSAMVTVRQEVDMLEAYMSLMCYRYPQINYCADVSSEVLDLSIPNFILQPLLENSLLHGLKDRRYQGTITLRIYLEGEQELVIWIIDDGIGISDTKMEELNTYDKKDCETLYRTQTEDQESRTHLGVINVISRLKLYYEDACRISYTRNDSGGTTVEIRIRQQVEKHE